MLATRGGKVFDTTPQHVQFVRRKRESGRGYEKGEKRVHPTRRYVARYFVDSTPVLQHLCSC